MPTVFASLLGALFGAGLFFALPHNPSTSTLFLGTLVEVGDESVVVDLELPGPGMGSVVRARMSTDPATIFIRIHNRLSESVYASRSLERVSAETLTSGSRIGVIPAPLESTKQFHATTILLF